MTMMRPDSGSMRRRLGIIGVAASAVVLSLLLLVDWTHSPDDTASDAAITELIGPRNLDDATGTAGGLMDPNLSVSLPEGGWLQVADDTGRLAQQYRFTHLDPNPQDLPAHWIEMQDPEVELFMGGGRLVVLSGDEAVAYAPRRALEEGRLLGNVVIRMFEPVRGGYADPSRDDPALTITTNAAAFDNLSGRIRCAGHLKVQTPTEQMEGRNLQVLLNDRDDRIEYLEIASVDYLLLKDAGTKTLAATHSPLGPRKRRVGRRILPVALVDKTPPFYRLTMRDDVRIEQTPPEGTPAGNSRIATANSLHVVFSFESNAFNSRSAAATASAGQPLGIPSIIAATAIGFVPPIPSPEEVLITCSGPLTMVPLENAEKRPARPEDMRLELHGSPVRILDTAQRTTALCDQVEWRSADERFDLTATSPRHVIITSPDVTIESQQTWIRPEAGLAGVEGGGLATLVASAVPAQHGSDATDHRSGEETTIAWTGRVDMRFSQAISNDRSDLESIRFLEDVEVLSPDGTITADDLEMRFEPGDDGEAVPDRLIGSGSIRAASDEQVLWADELLATLGPAEAEPPSDAQSPTGNIEVRDVLATGNVQILMADGARVWADTLQGDARQESVELTAADLVVARGEVVIERGRSLQVRRLEGTADWPGSGRALMLATQPDLHTDGRIHKPATPEQRGELDSEIVWTEAVHIDFDPTAEQQDAAMRSIEFAGDVAMTSPDGTIGAGTLTMHFTPDESGKSTPSRLQCQRRVRAASEGQTLWADELIATLEPVDGESDSAGDSPIDRVTVREFLATGDVQVLMKDNARAFADRLEGDAKQEVAVLTGDDVIIARQDVLLDRGQHLRIDRLAGTADWGGSGRSRMLAEPLSLSMDARIPLPRIVGAAGDPRVTMRTLWTESLHYDTNFGDGAGAMDIRGDVDMVTDRSDTQRSSLQGQRVRLEFANLSTDATPPPPSDDPFKSGSRILHTLIAKGNAKLETRTWRTEARTVLPRVFFVAAQHITWDDIKTEAEVVGDGEIVIREPEWTAQPAAKDAGQGPFSGPGTSRFIWSERLDLVHESDDRFRMTMLGDVEGLWKSAVERRDVATITAQEVYVLTRRSDTTIAPSGDAPLQLGEDMEIDRLRAVERVYLTTPTRKADCHMLDYNTRTKIAELVARSGRTVSLITEGSPMPVQATRMIWNMDPAIDTITLEQPRGSGAR
ncbi:MAG: hypothetical protein QGG74_04900 [Phycisphaerales bacterium]|nr:hypothetical protein [Phycisphaerales bacterium]